LPTYFPTRSLHAFPFIRLDFSFHKTHVCVCVWCLCNRASLIQ
jgi:hypothetical protein